MSLENKTGPHNPKSKNCTNR